MTLVAVFGDAHAHAEALEAVLGAAERDGAEQLWSLGDMVGGGPDPEHVVVRTRERCAVALLGNHYYGATGASTRCASVSPDRSPCARSSSHASSSGMPRSSGCGHASPRPARRLG